MSLRIADLFADERFKVNTWNASPEWNSIMGQAESKPTVLAIDTFIVPGTVITYEAKTNAERLGTEPEVENLFFVKHKCSFNAEHLWVVDDAHHKGYYVKKYRIRTSVIDDSGNVISKADAHLAAAEPTTTESVTHKSVSVSESFSASGGSMGGPMATVGAGFDMSSSVSFDIKDVTIVSDSNGEASHDGVDCSLQLTPVSLGGDRFGPPNLNYPAAVSHAEFTPELIELWAIKGRPASQFRLRVTVYLEIEYFEDHSTSGGFAYHWSTHSGHWENSFEVDHAYADAP